ncbi:MAG: NB-ARC domain protein [Planctomycetota bacterium]|nr:NB-ARC domain protein [Planctomycetota bacterium]
MFRLAIGLCLFGFSSAMAADEPKKSAPIKPIDVVELKRPEPVTYDKDIEPILVKKCNFCHSGNIKEGKLDMGTFEALMKGGKKGTPLVAGKAADSLIYQLSGKTTRPSMPPKSEEPLTPEELALLKLWINQGAKAPSAARVKPKVVVSLPPATVYPVRGIVITKDKANLIAARGNMVHVYDANTGALVRNLEAKNLVSPDGKPAKASHISIVESLAISPDGKLLASGSFQEVRIWDAATGAEVKRIDGFADRVVALTFSPDSKLLATAGGAATEDGEVKIFDVATGKQLLDIKGAHSDTAFGVAFSPDGKMLASCGADKFVKIFEVPSGKPVKSFEGHTHHVMDVAWKNDGKFLASAGADNAIKVWDFEKGEQARTIAGHTKQISRLQFVGITPTFITCSGDKSLRIWNVDTGGAVKTFANAEDFLYALAASVDGTIVASGGEAGIIYIYNNATGALIKKLGPTGAIEPEKAPLKK